MFTLFFFYINDKFTPWYYIPKAYRADLKFTLFIDTVVIALIIFYSMHG